MKNKFIGLSLLCSLIVGINSTLQSAERQIFSQDYGLTTIDSQKGKRLNELTIEDFFDEENLENTTLNRELLMRCLESAQRNAVLEKFVRSLLDINTRHAFFKKYKEFDIRNEFSPDFDQVTKQQPTLNIEQKKFEQLSKEKYTLFIETLLNDLLDEKFPNIDYSHFQLITQESLIYNRTTVLKMENANIIAAIFTYIYQKIKFLASDNDYIASELTGLLNNASNDKLFSFFNRLQHGTLRGIIALYNNAFNKDGIIKNKNTLEAANCIIVSLKKYRRIFGLIKDIEDTFNKHSDIANFIDQLNKQAKKLQILQDKLETIKIEIRKSIMNDRMKSTRGELKKDTLTKETYDLIAQYNELTEKIAAIDLKNTSSNIDFKHIKELDDFDNCEKLAQEIFNKQPLSWNIGILENSEKAKAKFYRKEFTDITAKLNRNAAPDNNFAVVAQIILQDLIPPTPIEDINLVGAQTLSESNSTQETTRSLSSDPSTPQESVIKKPFTAPVSHAKVILPQVSTAGQDEMAAKLARRRFLNKEEPATTTTTASTKAMAQVPVTTPISVKKIPPVIAAKPKPVAILPAAEARDIDREQFLSFISQEKYKDFEKNNDFKVLLVNLGSAQAIIDKAQLATENNNVLFTQAIIKTLFTLASCYNDAAPNDRERELIISILSHPTLQGLNNTDCPAGSIRRLTALLKYREDEDKELEGFFDNFIAALR